MPSRKEKVETLTKAGLNGIADVVFKDPDVTGDEVISACFSIALNGIKVAIEMGADKAKLKENVQALMLHCVDTKEPSMDNGKYNLRVH